MGKSCKPVTHITTKKMTQLDDFFVHAFTAKKKLHDVTIFLLHAFTAKKKLHNLPQKQIYTM